MNCALIAVVALIAIAVAGYFAFQYASKDVAPISADTTVQLIETKRK